MVDILGTDAVWVSLVSIRVTTCGKTLYIYLLAVLYSAPEGRTWNGVWWVLHWCCLLVSVFWIYTNPELRGSRSAPVIFFSWPHCSWSSVLVLFGGWSKPDSDGWAKNWLDYCSVQMNTSYWGGFSFQSWRRKYIWIFLMIVSIFYDYFRSWETTEHRTWRFPQLTQLSVITTVLRICRCMLFWSRRLVD